MNITTLIKAIALLAAAAIVGNWFLSEVKQAKIRRDPWYTPYLSPPGLLILAALALPVIIWLVRN